MTTEQSDMLVWARKSTFHSQSHPSTYVRLKLGLGRGHLELLSSQKEVRDEGKPLGHSNI